MVLQENYKVISDVIEYNELNLYVIAPGIVVSEYKADFELDFALEINSKIGELTKGKAMPQLFIACPRLSVSKEVREWGVTEVANQYSLTSAVVCNLLSHRILGNFLIKVQRPPRLTKMFSSMNGAIDWLCASIQ